MINKKIALRTIIALLMSGTGLIASQAIAAITVTDAKIAGGRLVVTGTSDIGETVSLDGHYTTEVSNRAFSFSLVYVPASCVVSLVAPGTTSPTTRAAVANCAPMPVNPAGEWQSGVRYVPNDLVERQKGQYLALANPRENLNEDPLYATSFWRAVPVQNATAEQTILVGPKGERGEAGAAGTAGRDGAKGDKGDKGEDGVLAHITLFTIKADLTMPPMENGQAKGDWKVSSNGTLAVSIAKDGHEAYADLLIPASSMSDPESCTLSGTVFDGGAEKIQGSMGRMKKMGDTIVLPIRTTGEITHVEALLLCPSTNK